MTLGQYILRRNGVPAGAAGSLRNMLRRSLGAASFAGFWRHWNPVFGYGLSRYVHSPLLRVVPAAIAVVVTFAVCGALHDLVTTLVRGSPTLFFTFWFVLLGAGVIAGRAAGIDLSDRMPALRVGVNLAYVATCLALSIAARRIFGVP